MGGTDEDQVAEEVRRLAGELSARRAEYQERARRWMSTPAFQEVYEDQHPGMLFKVLATLLGAGSAWKTRGSSLRKGYARLAEAGELIFAGTVIGNSGMREKPDQRLPACVIASGQQDVESLAKVVLFGMELSLSYDLGDTEAFPQSSRIVADDAYRPLRRRPLPTNETAGLQMMLFDIRASADEIFSDEQPPFFVPLLVHPDGGPFTVIPWHVLQGRTAPVKKAGPPPLPGSRPASGSKPPPLPGQRTEPEVSRGGSTIHRHAARERDFEFAIGNGDDIEAIGNHIERHLGEVKSVFHEIISDLVHIDVHLLEPTAERPFYTLVTSGMSDRPMTVPQGAEEYRYAELMICLPPDWKLEQQKQDGGKGDFEDERNYWPIRWLKQLARLPHEYQTWLGPGHTIPNGDPAEPLAEGVSFSGFLICQPLTVPDEFHLLDISPEKKVNFYGLIPLTSPEMEFKLNFGTQQLAPRLAKYRVTELVDLRRASVA